MNELDWIILICLVVLLACVRIFGGRGRMKPAPEEKQESQPQVGAPPAEMREEAGCEATKTDATGEETPSEKDAEKPSGEARAYIASGQAGSKGGLFHQVGCKTAERINSERAAYYASPQEAMEAGCRPCTACQPDQEEAPATQ